MLWFGIALIAVIIAATTSTARDRADNVFATAFLGFVIALAASAITSAVWTGQTHTHTKIVTPIERAIVNDEVVLQFKTADGKMWSLPAETPMEPNYDNQVVYNEYTNPQWLWSVFPAFAINNYSITVAS